MRAICWRVTLKGVAISTQSPLAVSVDVVAIHPDEQQVLVDQGGNAVRVPRLNLPHPVVVEGQPIMDRFTRLVEVKYGLRGRILGLSPGLGGTGAGNICAVFLAQDAGPSADLDRRGLRWRQIATLQALSNQESSAQLQAAINLVRARRISDSLKEAWSTTQSRILILLRERMVESDGLSGWTQFLDGDSVGVLSTAQGILAFLEAGAIEYSLRRNLETVRTLQNEDGGWPVRRALIGRSERSITESTVYCLWALTRAGADLQQAPLLRGIDWLERAQIRDGGWGSTSTPARPRVYPTAFAARYLATAAGGSEAVRQAVNWLRGAQNADGGWGALKEASAAAGSTPLHTAHALLGLLAARVDPADVQVEQGLRYLRGTLHAGDDEPWPSTSEVETVDADAALDFRHFTTPWVLCALLAAGTPVGDPVVTAGLQWILREQHSLGYWSSRLTPGRTPMWATFDALHALAEVRRAALDRVVDLIDADAKAIELDFAWTKYFAAVDDLNRPAALPVARNGWIYAWNAVLTFAVVLILLFQGPLAAHVSTAAKIIGSALIGLIPGFGPFVYQLILNEIGQRRGKAS